MYCCGCLDLRKGVFCIGSFGVITSLVLMIIEFGALVDRGNILLDKNDKSSNYLFSFIFVTGIAVNFFKLNSDVLLLVGASNRTTREVSVWLVVNLCHILYIFISMVFLYALLAEHETKFSFAAVLSIETMIFGLNVFFIYLWYQVYIFSRQLYLEGRTSLEAILHNGPVAV